MLLTCNHHNNHSSKGRPHPHLPNLSPSGNFLPRPTTDQKDYKFHKPSRRAAHISHHLMSWIITARSSLIFPINTVISPSRAGRDLSNNSFKETLNWKWVRKLVRAHLTQPSTSRKRDCQHRPSHPSHPLSTPPSTRINKNSTPRSFLAKNWPNLEGKPLQSGRTPIKYTKHMSKPWKKSTRDCRNRVANFQMIYEFNNIPLPLF